MRGLGAGETVHFNSDDLELGNPRKGLTGSTGAGAGAWRLALKSELDLEVLSYIRTEDGFLTAMHDLAPVGRGRPPGPGNEPAREPHRASDQSLNEDADHTPRPLNLNGGPPGEAPRRSTSLGGLARIRHQLSSRGRRGAVLRGRADRRAMQAYSAVRQIGRREHGRAGRVHRRPQQEVGDGCGLGAAGHEGTGRAGPGLVYNPTTELAANFSTRGSSHWHYEAVTRQRRQKSHMPRVR